MCSVSTNGERACPAQGFQLIGGQIIIAVDSTVQFILNEDFLRKVNDRNMIIVDDGETEKLSQVLTKSQMKKL